MLFHCTLHRQTPAILLCKWIQQFLLDLRPMREILKYCFFSTTTQKARLGPISLLRGLGIISFILTYFWYRYWGLNPGCQEINTLVLLAITIKPSLYQGFFYTNLICWFVRIDIIILSYFNKVIFYDILNCYHRLEYNRF